MVIGFNLHIEGLPCLDAIIDMKNKSHINYEYQNYDDSTQTFASLSMCMKNKLSVKSLLKKCNSIESFYHIVMNYS